MVVILKHSPNRESLRRIMAEVDEDFIPSFTQRGFDAVLDGLMESTVWTICADNDDAPLGFMSLQHGEKVEALRHVFAHHGQIDTYCQYIALSPCARGKGIAKHAYQELLGEYGNIGIKTWSTNAAQVRLLPHLGFAQVAVLPNDRGPGVDSLYYHHAGRAAR